MTIPILWNHDHTRPVGTIVQQDCGRLFIRLNEDLRIADNWVWKLGIKVTDMERAEDGTITIKAGEIVEVSLVPTT